MTDSVVHHRIEKGLVIFFGLNFQSGCSVIMRLTQVLLRKRKMNTKGDRFVRNWQWNNAWYLNQERKVFDIGQKAAAEARGIPVYKPEELFSPLHTFPPNPRFQTVETAQVAGSRDESHPLWQPVAAHCYGDRTWLPKNCQLQFAAAITNSLTVAALPDRLNPVRMSTSSQSVARLATAVKNANIGDATQKLLPKNYRQPYIGWHPVESKMRPRNLYDHTKASWGRSFPREYGVPNTRKVTALCRALVAESGKLGGAGLELSVEPEKHRQLVERPGGRRVRLSLTIPLTAYSATPLTAHAGPAELPELQVDHWDLTDPVDPVVTLHPTHIYQTEPAHPVRSSAHSQPHAHTVFSFYTSHISPEWKSGAERARTLMAAFTVALGQARLRWPGETSDLPEPVTLNTVSTDGRTFSLGCFQLNSLDLSSATRNVFWYQSDQVSCQS